MARRIALIMAGGGGTRLWPASRPPRPKQVLDPLLADPKGSLVRATAERLHGLVEPDDVWVVVGHDQLSSVRAALPAVPESNFVVEPARRNTAPCIALSLAFIRAARGAHADDTTLIVLPADHHVRDPDRLRHLVVAACVHAEAAQAIVTLGIEPDHAATGFGYIERAGAPLPAISGDGDVPVFGARRFVEKPDAATAEGFLEAGVYCWNAGIFVMPARRIDDELSRHCAPLQRALQPVADALRRGDDAQAEVAAAYDGITAAPIDTAVMEHVSDLRVIPASVGWTDLGSWRSVHAIGPADEAGNVTIAADDAAAVVLDGCDNLVWSEDATVGVIGVSGLAVVASAGRVLVCPLHRAQEVKALLDALPDAERE